MVKTGYLNLAILLISWLAYVSEYFDYAQHRENTGFGG